MNDPSLLNDSVPSAGSVSKIALNGNPAGFVPVSFASTPVLAGTVSAVSTVAV